MGGTQASRTVAGPGPQQVPTCSTTGQEFCQRGGLVWVGGPQACAHTRKDMFPF